MYGLLISLSILICILYTKYLAKKRDLDGKLVWDLAFWVILGGVVGARIYHVITDWQYYINDPIKLVYIWNGGLGIFGAIVGGTLTTVIFFHIKKAPVWQWLNILGVIAPLGQSIGRWGNFFNNELLGKTIVDVSLGLSCSSANINGVNTCSLRHPTFLYESILTFSLFLILNYLFLWKRSTYTFVLYVMGYSLIRFFIEFFKAGTTPLNGTQLLCLLLFITFSTKLFIDIKSTKT